jgi:hypothetical protein
MRGNDEQLPHSPVTGPLKTCRAAAICDLEANQFVDGPPTGNAPGQDTRIVTDKSACRKLC